MHILFGLDADGGTWPATSDASTAQAGGAVVGPRGLLGIVETALGLGGPVQPAAVRLARWRAKLAAADSPERFWHASFRTRFRATARLILGMRDALVEAGWHSTALATPPARLADLAAVEVAGAALPAGPADRLRAALVNLAADPPPAPIIERLALLDDRALLPPGVAALISALADTGTMVRAADTPDVPAAGDLGTVQKLLRAGAPGELDNDGRFTLLEAETEGAAVEMLAERLAAEPRPQELVIIASRPTGVLDAALRRRHLPRLGISAASPSRGLTQVLPLALATRWQPFEALRLLELVQLRRSPIPNEVCKRLVALLPGCPGHGGPQWRAAITEGLAAQEERYRAIAAETATARTRAARGAVATWLEAPLADPEAGMPLEDLAAACTALGAWAGSLAGQAVPLAASLAAQARALLEAAQATGLTTLTRLDLERLLDAVLAEGETDPTVSTEASPWAVVPAPGAVWGRPQTLVWWGFDVPPLPARLPWDAAETGALEAAGCLPWTPEAALAAAAAAWHRPLLRALDRVILVAVRWGGAEAHPLAHELAPLLERAPACHPVAEALLVAPAPLLAGRSLQRLPVVTVSLPEARAEWVIPAGLGIARDRHSATSIELLLGCPFAWTLRHHARLRPGRRAEVADGERLIGLLAHRLSSELFTPGPGGDPATLAAAATVRLPALIEEAAAPLLHPGAAVERARLTDRLPLAIAAIARLLLQSGLIVVEGEANRRATDMPETGEAFAGTVDLLLQDASGRPVVLDLKWTRAGHRYREQLEKGLAIQLAAYAKLVGAGERAAYLLLADAEAFATSGARLGTAVRGDAPSLDATWQAVLAARRLRAAAISSGTLRALGLDYDHKKPPPDPDGVLAPPAPPCKFCNFRSGFAARERMA